MSLPPTPPNPLHHSPELQRLREVLWVRVDVLDPLIEKGRSPIGTIRDVDLSYVMPDHEYLEVLDLLCLLPLPGILYYAMAPRSRFCRQFHGVRHRFDRARRFRSLYHSILDKGFQSDPRDVYSIPWILAAGRHTLRLHARHRSALARFFGVGAMPALVVTPSDLLGVDGVPEKYRLILEQLPEPSIDLQHRPAGLPPWLTASANST